MVNRQNQKTIKPSGRTALEMLGVLAVIGAIGAGATQLANLAMRKNATTQSILELQDISDKIRALYSWKSNYRSPDNMLTYLKSQNVLRVKSDGTPIPPAGTSISMTGERLTSAGASCATNVAGCVEVFTITLAALPKEHCLEMSIYDWGNYVFRVNGVLASGKDASGYPLLPMSKSKALTSCNSETQDFSISFF